MHGKERVSGFGNAFLKKDKSEEKPTFKYSSKLLWILLVMTCIGLRFIVSGSWHLLVIIVVFERASLVLLPINFFLYSTRNDK